MRKKHLLLAAGCAIVLISCLIFLRYSPERWLLSRDDDQRAYSRLELMLQPFSRSSVEKLEYHAKQFDFAAVQGLSEDQLLQHEQLYKGYVAKRNTIEDLLGKTNKTGGNPTYAPLRGLKVAQSYARNGALLHELYFENIGNAEPSSPGPQMQQLIEINFKTVDAYKRDLFQTALCARGWVVTGYCMIDGTIKNYLFDSHNQIIPVLVLPLVVVDVYEHAYMIDFGINRKEYLNVIWKILDWDAIEQRIHTWLNTA